MSTPKTTETLKHWIAGRINETPAEVTNRVAAEIIAAVPRGSAADVDLAVVAARAAFPGWRQSMFGDTAMNGSEGVHFCTRAKTVTSRWQDPSLRGVNLGFPQNT